MREGKSLLTRKEEARSIRRALIYGGLTLVLALGVIFFGIPALIRMAILLGDFRNSSQPVESKETLAPPPPTFVPEPEATNSAILDLHGFSESGSLVKVFVNDESQEVVASQDGTFVLTGIQLIAGNNQIWATAQNQTGNTSEESEKMTIIYDNTPPDLEITSPTDKDSFYGDQNKVEVIGRTEANANVWVNDHLVVVGREGDFSYPVLLQEGNNPIKVSAKDLAGNETIKELSVSYSR
jgi:hypothetical protein